MPWGFGELIRAGRDNDRVVARRIDSDDCDAGRSTALGNNAARIDPVRLQMGEHLLAEIICTDAAEKKAPSRTSRRSDRLVRALAARMKRDALAKHRLTQARMPVARRDDVHVDRA